MKKEEREAKKCYNKMADAYHASRVKRYPRGWFYNEMLEMPAMLSILGNVKGKKILDFGCGSGIYAKLLTKKGAIVKGFDISNKMISIAKKENPDILFKIGGGYNIPFKEKFDIVQASLVLDYFNDWNKVFKEVSRVLNKNGIFVFSTNNPIRECVKRMNIGKKKIYVFGKINYFKEKPFYDDWKFENEQLVVKVPCYHKTYETIIKTIIKNGFEITDYKDCFPLKKSKKLFKGHYKIWSSIPYFCVWKVRKV
jgi:SAM-dependent methyltransferase